MFNAVLSFSINSSIDMHQSPLTPYLDVVRRSTTTFGRYRATQNFYLDLLRQLLDQQDTVLTRDLSDEEFDRKYRRHNERWKRLFARKEIQVARRKSQPAATA